jgi:hypothetical protein
MTGPISGRAYDSRRGMCNVEHIGGDHFRLIPDRNPNDRLIQHRAQIQWRRARVAH